jgi:hypothetical protein
MSKTQIAWGFLACGWVVPGAALLADYAAGIAVGCLAAAVWCLTIAFLNMELPSGDGE